MSYVTPLPQAQHFDGIHLDIHIDDATGNQIEFDYPQNMMHFYRCYRLPRYAAAQISPGLDLKEAQRLTFLRHDIYFTAPAPEIAFQNFISALPQITASL